jgi:hypothetical protein
VAAISPMGPIAALYPDVDNRYLMYLNLVLP